jgi:CRP/FNR family transcriptional regulator, cyclic AMP receptor protein
VRGKERRDARERLRAIDIFSACTDHELDTIDRLMTEVRFSEGQRITRQGAGALEFVIIIDGAVSVAKDNDIVATVRAGSFVGEIGLLDKNNRNATVTAAGDVRAFVLDAGEFERLLAASPSVRDRVEATAAARRDQA